MTGLQAAPIDDRTSAYFLKVPGEKVVLLQAIIEMYEGVGVVRTIDIRTSAVCVLTTVDQIEDCRSVLESIRDIVPWVADPETRDPQQALISYGERTEQ